MEWANHFLDSLKDNGGSFIVGVLLLVFGSTAILSERTAKEKFGAIGLLAGWIQHYKERVAAQEEALFHRRTEDLWAEIKRVDAARQADRERFKQELKDLRDAERLKHQYTVWAAERVRDLEVWAATNGLVLPTPKILPFLEWITEYEEEIKEGEDEYD